MAERQGVTEIEKSKVEEYRGREAVELGWRDEYPLVGAHGPPGHCQRSAWEGGGVSGWLGGVGVRGISVVVVVVVVLGVVELSRPCLL